MADIRSPQSLTEFPLALVKNMITLATSGFGVVVALAWNEAIKQLVDQFINPYLGAKSGVVSLFIYAMIMTFLAVMVTMQLSQIEKKMELIAERVRLRSEANVKSKQLTRKS